MRIVLCGLVALVGCRSSLELDGGRAYQCSRDAGVTGCQAGWSCGSDNRCFDPVVGTTRPCVVASSDCGGGFKCGLDLQCFDPKSATPRTCSDPALHCPDGWKCGIDRICFDPNVAQLDAGARRCTDAVTHCEQGQRCGLDGLCFAPTRSPDAGAGPDCRTDDQCPASWRCGAEESSGRRRCQPVGVGGPWFCTTDSDCEALWRCNPVELVCAEVREPLAAPPFTSTRIVFLSGADAGRTPDDVVGSPLGRLETQGQLGNFDVTTIGALTGSVLSVQAWTTNDPRLPDGGTLAALKRRFTIDAQRVVGLAATTSGVLAHFDGGAVFQYTHLSDVPVEVTRTAVLLRQSLNTSELGVLVPSDGGLALLRVGGAPSINPTTFPAEPCRQGSGRLIDFAYAVEPTQVRSVFLTERAVCFGMNGNLMDDVGPPWSLPPGFTPRRLHFNAHEGPGGFVQNFGMGRLSAISSMVVEYVAPDGGQLLGPVQLSDWNQFPSLQVQNQTLPEPCATACPDDVRALELVPLQSVPNRSEQSFLARCPRSVASATNDGGEVPEGTYLVNAQSTQCGRWRRSPVRTIDEEAPRRWPLVTSKTPTNRRFLAGPDDRFWSPIGDGGTTPKPFTLDRLPDFAVRVYLDPGNPRLFLASQARQFAALPQTGVVAQNDFPDSLYPVGSVTGRAAWAVTRGLVMDVARFPPASELPFTVASAPAGVTWATPARGVERGGYLFVASDDTISVGNVARQLQSVFVAPAAMTRAIVPLPGLPVRALAARQLTDGGVPELWSVTSSGVHRSESTNGLNWTTNRVSLGANDALALLPWVSGTAMRLLYSTGSVVSLPTAVPLAREPVVGGRVVSAERFCGATWALVQAPSGVTDLFVLEGTPGDGGLADWRALSRPSTEGPLSTAKLQATATDLLLMTEWGDVVSLVPNADCALFD